mmetsp:Transcript_44124/g.120259  ORF Transcript_44124/g.120259 Transcript_44124/m.120259 type:complete len:255 (+) Transcript_44124:392-1156(+)
MARCCAAETPRLSSCTSSPPSASVWAAAASPARRSGIAAAVGGARPVSASKLAMLSGKMGSIGTLSCSSGGTAAWSHASSVSKICSAEMRTSRASRSTTTPSRASSYSRLPSLWSAENMGGTCLMSPRKSAAARSRSAWLTCACGRVSVVSPVESSVSVSTPSTPTPRYRLAPERYEVRSRQPLPTPMTSTPVASGSSVPPWPTLTLIFCPPFRAFSSFCSTHLILPTTSAELQPCGLYTAITPSGTPSRRLAD